MTDSFAEVTDIDYQQLTKTGLTYFNHTQNRLLLTSGILVTFVELFNIKHIMNEELFPSCPIRNILSRFSDKWSLLVLYTLNLQPTMRFNALRREIPDISQKMLTNTFALLKRTVLLRALFMPRYRRGWNTASPTGRALCCPMSILL